jgi:DNA invertase Pin-like site-specific DNA recombinase
MIDEGGRFTGMTFGAIRRNSTRGQRDNYAARHQVESVEALIAREGGAVALYDEQATSGRRLSKRAVARDLLDDVRAKVVDGIAVTVLDRLTRDELGKDAATIAEVLIDARALLVTLDQTFRLWNKDDLLFYKLKTGLAGHEVQGITERFWNGIFQKAKEEHFFLGPTPLGYTTRLEEAPARPATGRKKARRVPVRDEGEADLLGKLAAALDECTTLAEVADRLNLAGDWRVAHTGRIVGAPVRWRADQIRFLLDNPIYHGVWAFGRHSKRRSPIWDAMPTGVARRLETFTMDVPELAWWPRERVDGWRAKYAHDAGQPAKRHRAFARPLRGLLVCASCGATMTAAGANGYVCPHQHGQTGRHLCPNPQMISEPLALRALREAVNLAVAERADYRERLRAKLARPDRGDEREAELDELRSALAGMEAQWYGDGAPAVVPDFAVRLMSEAQAKVNALAAEVARDRRQGALSPEDEAIFEALGTRPGDALAVKEPARQAMVFRRALADVRIELSGHGGGRTFRVAGYVNRLLRT